MTKNLRSLLLFWCCSKRNGWSVWNYWNASSPFHFSLLLITCQKSCKMSEKWRVKSEKVKIPHFRAGFLAGAGGFEPATHGFGVAFNVRKALKILTFSPVSTHFSHKTVCRTCVWKILMLYWCYEKLRLSLLPQAWFWCSSRLKICIAENLLRKVNSFFKNNREFFWLTWETPKGRKGVNFFAREVFGFM